MLTMKASELTLGERRRADMMVAETTVYFKRIEI